MMSEADITTDERKTTAGGFEREKFSPRTIAHINLRGGIGKTTATITLASLAVQLGLKTCILDLDSQGSASLAFNKIPADDDPVFYDIWQKPAEMTMGSIRKIRQDLYILPSSLQNGLLDSSLSNPASQKNAVRNVCAELKKNGFELLLIDCPPSLGTAVISTVCAADIVVIPVGSDAFSFKGLELTLSEISSICETYGLSLPLIRILYSKFDRREKISLESLERLQTEYKDRFIPFPVRTSSDFSKALARRETVFSGGKRSTAKEDYSLYGNYILNFPLHSTR